MFEVERIEMWGGNEVGMPDEDANGGSRSQYRNRRKPTNAPIAWRHVPPRLFEILKLPCESNRMEA
jgi:hypothetical protein